MHYILFLLFTLTIFSSHADNLNIVTSTNHLESIANMIIGDNHAITVISNTGGCPEHYHLKPSDVGKVKNADLVIYIDNRFENFIVNLLPKNQKNILKISSIDGVRIKDNNLHIWLDLENTKLILESLCDILSVIDPDNKKTWHNNLETSKSELEELSRYKNNIFSKLRNIVLLSDSLEYLLPKADKLYIYPGMGTLQTLSKLQNIDKNTCLLASSNENWEIFANKISHKIVTLDSEKWSKNYIEHYRRIIDIIAKECAQ